MVLWAYAAPPPHANPLRKPCILRRKKPARKSIGTIGFAATTNATVQPITPIDAAQERVIAVGIDVSAETPDVGAATGAALSKAILQAQSADIDGVSGATITSDAVKAAAGDAFNQAM